MNTQEGNKLIAEFMGYVMHDHASYKTFEKDGRHIFDSVLQYDTKWDWMMPVVERIEKLGRVNEVSIKGKWCFINCSGNDFRSRGEISKIDAVWNTVIQFITWYNSTSK